MDELAALLLMNVLLCVGFHVLTRYNESQLVAENFKQPLWFIAAGARKISPIFAKPVCDCLVCMASLHSILPYWFIHAWDTDTLLVYPAYVIALAGANALVEPYLP